MDLLVGGAIRSPVTSPAYQGELSHGDSALDTSEVHPSHQSGGR